MAEPIADANQTTYSDFVKDWAIEGWCDPGELGAIRTVADRVRGEPILDIGVGGGRTTSLLRLLSSRYVGIDYNADLVELCRSRQPGVDIRHADARDLSAFETGSQRLVMFSYNGIDTVGHDDRQTILAEVYRVLAPGGSFLFSTLNKNNATFGARPGEAPARPFQPGTLLRAEPKPHADTETDEAEPRWLRAVRNWRRLRKEMIDEDDWGIAPNPGQEYSLLNHFITIDGERRELARHGFQVEHVFSDASSLPLTSDEPVHSIYMYLVAIRG